MGELVTGLAVGLPVGPGANLEDAQPTAVGPPQADFFASAAAREWAVRLRGAAAAHRAASGAAPSLEEECAREPDLCALRDTIGEARFTTAWQESQEQPWERAVMFPFAEKCASSRRDEAP
jgi:hypothetical protein